MRATMLHDVTSGSNFDNITTRRRFNAAIATAHVLHSPVEYFMLA
jgi:hypothetical protein